MIKSENHIDRKFNYGSILLIFVSIIVCVFSTYFQPNADTLFPFRYADSFFSPSNIKIIVQPGARFFPDVFYAFVGRFFTDNAIHHFYIIILINILILAFSSQNFLDHIIKDKYISTLTACIFVLLLPSSFIISKNQIPFNLLMPGMHAFTATLSLLCLNIFLKLFKHSKLRVIDYFVFAFLTLIISINNQIFILILSIPVLGSLLALKAISYNFNYKPFILISFLLSLTIIVSFFGDYFWSLFSNFHVRSQNNNYFDVSLYNWIKGNGHRFFTTLFSFKHSGIFVITFIVSIFSSIYVLFKHISQPNIKNYSNKILFLNIFNLLTFFILILALWAINKHTFRYSPHLFIFSTLILTTNIIDRTKLKRYINKFLIFRITVVLLLSIIFINYIINKPQYKFEGETRYDFLFEHLDDLKSQKIISPTGLADYWIANSTEKEYDLEILPLMRLGRPDTYAMNLMDFWTINRQRKKFTYIVNRFLPVEKRWYLHKESIFKKFGLPKKILEIKQKKWSHYEIYIYTELNTDSIFNHLKIIQNKYFNP